MLSIILLPSVVSDLSSQSDNAKVMNPSNLNALLLCYAEDIVLAWIFDFSARWNSSALDYWCMTLFGHKTSAALDWEQRSDSVASKVTRLYSLRFLYVGLRAKLSLFCSYTISTSYERTDLTMDCNCKYWNFKTVWKTINLIINQIQKVNAGSIEQTNI